MHWIVSICLFLCLAGPARADETFEVGADSLLFSQIGSLVRVTDPGAGGATYHCFEFGNLVRIYGIREFGSEDWEIPSTPVYLCPVAEMLPGLGWRFLDDDFGNLRTAEAVRQESVTVPAGNFPNAWRVEVRRDDQPGVLDEVFWYAAGVGIIQHVEWAGGQIVRRSQLTGSDVQGAGYFPLIEGNSWQYTDATVSGDRRSVSSLKDLYQR
jgi:hypothetical protein